MTQTIEHAMVRAMSRTHQRFQDLIVSLATMTTLAPFAGLFCTLLLIVGSFRAPSGEKGQALANLTNDLGLALVPTAFGIGLGLMCSCAYRYFHRRLAILDREMTVTAEVWTDWFLVVGAGNAASTRDHDLHLEVLDPGDAWHHSIKTVSAILAFGWVAQTVALFWLDFIPMADAPGAALRSLVLPVLCAFLATRAIWVDLLRR
ncbi:hypothetical protein F183_A27060 [Bryobacterales bacterium F-183]|nr:hypothetical protein F183_A27060 [Bryobacterales bacterium F-183]